MSGWSSTGWTNATGDNRWWMKRESAGDVARPNGRWTAPDVVGVVVAFLVHWELGLAFLALKLWQQASGHPGNALTFGVEKWEQLVATARRVVGGGFPTSFHVGPRSSGNHAFDAWRETELRRIEAERAKLRDAERAFATYRDELLHAKDREDFERFMQSRDRTAP